MLFSFEITASPFISYQSGQNLVAYIFVVTNSKNQVANVTVLVAILSPAVILEAFHYAKLTVGDQWEYPRKMGQHFLIKPGQPKGTTLTIF